MCFCPFLFTGHTRCSCIIRINRWVFDCCLVILCVFVFLLLIFICAYRKLHFAHMCISFAICLVNFVVFFFKWEMATTEKRKEIEYNTTDSGSQINSQNILLSAQKTSWITSLKSNYVWSFFSFFLKTNNNTLTFIVFRMELMGIDFVWHIRRETFFLSL